MKTAHWLIAAALLTLGAGPARAADDWQAGAGDDWKKVLEAARKEGTVTVAGRATMGRPFADAFKRDTGITLEFLGGESRDIASRVDREMRSGHVSIDVVMGGASDIEAAKSGKLTPIRPQFMLPGVLDMNNWNSGKLKWVDNDGTYLFIGNEYVHSWPMFNSANVNVDEIKAWTDLLKPQFKGKIAAYDPRSSGAGQAAAAYLASIHGAGFVSKLYLQQNVTLTRNASQLVEWAARGVHPIVIGSLAVEIEKFKSAGIRSLVVGSMTDGPGTILGGSSVAIQPKGGPHPAAATVFLNWYASKPAQEIFATVWHTPSRRTDVKVDNIPDYVVPKPGVTYLDQYTEDWYMNARPKLQQAVTDALGGQ